MTRPVLLDNTVLVNFAVVDRPDLVLDGPFEHVCTTPAVKAEYQMGVAEGQVPESTWGSLPCVELTPDEANLAQALSKRLGPGERSCLAVALHRDGLFASDDADARDVARQRDIPITGTLGFLVVAVKHGLCSRSHANMLLETMIDSGYRSPIDRIDSLLDPGDSPD
jgi:predicted nucleic acid-binding protein